MYELTVELDSDCAVPLYEQIYRYICREIKAGSIACDTKLPSTRALAAHLDVSRSTVDLAYAQLVSEGYVEAHANRGYFVSDISLLYDIPPKAREKKYPARTVETGNIIDFSPFGIAEEGFPYSAWRKISKKLLGGDNRELFTACHAKGEVEFRQTICGYLYGARGVRCTPEQIIVGAGNEYLLMVLNGLLETKEPVAMENPTYPRACHVFRKNGNVVLPVSMDKSGMEVASLRASGAVLAYVMPSHQFPMGTVMPIKRRLELLKWAGEEKGRYLIEDDYDSEFRYRGKPIPALQGVDDGSHVIYIGTFSKSIAPSVRMSYMVLPLPLLEIWENQKNRYAQTVSKMDQLIVNDFIREGYFERHLNKMRSLYRTKHDYLLGELRACGKTLHVSGENSGLHLVMMLDSNLSEKQLAEKALQEGVRVHGLSEYYMITEKESQEESRTKCQKPSFLIGFASLSQEQMAEGMQKLRKAWQLM